MDDLIIFNYHNFKGISNKIYSSNLILKCTVIENNNSFLNLKAQKKKQQMIHWFM